ncbi:unnamed protein product [Caenorhabditis angaria]|uniref:Uncharacterized protein n=1 Tax=Caenorhabditis angaria TaxID=860376 RepID=A0A9P1MYS4_9PELO|nr:unnamed protein product [Caenorhabditis angaria]
MEKVGELESVRWYRLTGQVDGKLTAKSVSNFQVGMKLIFSHSRSNRGYSKPIEIPIEVLEYDAMTKQISLLFDYAEKCKIQHFRCLFFSNSPENEYSYDPILHQFVKRDVLQKIKTSFASFAICQKTRDATTLRIASRSDLDDDFDFEKFRESLIDTVVGLSHSNKMSEKETLCHARIQCVEICNSRIVITVLNEETIDIWEDLDVWIYPIELYQNTEKSENLKSQITEIENDIYGQLNDGWKYLRGEFKRFRTKDEGEWRNEYSTVLQFKLIDENDNALLKFIQRGDKLRLSLDSDIPGPIFVRVTQVFHNSEDVCQIDQNTIYVAIIGFENTSTKMRLSKELPYYLSIDRDSQKSEAEKKEKENMSESGSCSSEDVVLHGYSLIENVDELCEIIGSLKLVESDVNSYADINGNQQTHCRLSFSVENRKSLKRFEWLEGDF